MIAIGATILLLFFGSPVPTFALRTAGCDSPFRHLRRAKSKHLLGAFLPSASVVPAPRPADNNFVNVCFEDVETGSKAVVPPPRPADNNFVNVCFEDVETGSKVYTNSSVSVEKLASMPIFPATLKSSASIDDDNALPTSTKTKFVRCWERLRAAFGLGDTTKIFRCCRRRSFCQTVVPVVCGGRTPSMTVEKPSLDPRASRPPARPRPADNNFVNVCFEDVEKTRIEEDKALPTSTKTIACWERLRAAFGRLGAKIRWSYRTGPRISICC